MKPGLEPTLEPVAVREAAEADVEAIAHVHVQAWRESYAGLIRPDILAGLSIEDRARMWRSALATRRPGFKLMVAEADDAVVGLGAAGPATPGPLGTEAEVFAVYLLDRVKRRGVGRRLVAALFAHLRAEGFGSVGLWAFAGNPAACRFYEALGGVAGLGREKAFEGQPPRRGRLPLRADPASSRWRPRGHLHPVLILRCERSEPRRTRGARERSPAVRREAERFARPSRFRLTLSHLGAWPEIDPPIPLTSS